MLLPKISIVMMNYNGEKYLERSINSVLSLNYPNFEFLIIDSNSDDKSMDIIKKNTIKYIQVSKKGAKNYACNLGVKKAHGNFILLIDNDIVFTDKNILYDLIETYNTLSDVGCLNLAYYDEGTNISKGYGNYLGYYFTKEIPEKSFDEIKKIHLSYIGHPSGICIFIKRELWLSIGGYDDHLKFGGDDCDLGMRLWMLGYKNYIYSKSIQMHIGMGERRNNKKYAIKFKDLFYAHLFTITKNYTLHNMIISLLTYTLFNLLKALKQAFIRKDLNILISYLKGLILYIKNIKIALKKRKIIQKERIIKDDIYLKIKSPL